MTGERYGGDGLIRAKSERSSPKFHQGAHLWQGGCRKP